MPDEQRAKLLSCLFTLLDAFITEEEEKTYPCLQHLADLITDLSPPDDSEPDEAEAA